MTNKRVEMNILSEGIDGNICAVKKSERMLGKEKFEPDIVDVYAIDCGGDILWWLHICAIKCSHFREI